MGNWEYIWETSEAPWEETGTVEKKKVILPKLINQNIESLKLHPFQNSSSFP